MSLAQTLTAAVVVAAGAAVAAAAVSGSVLLLKIGCFDPITALSTPGACLAISHPQLAHTAVVWELFVQSEGLRGGGQFEAIGWLEV